MGGNLTDDLAALIAMADDGVPIAKIARLLQRPVTWCERQLDQRQAKAEAEAAADRRRNAARIETSRANAARARKGLAEARRAAKSKTCSIDAGDDDLAPGEGRVTRAFRTGAGFGADVDLGDRQVFVETGAIRLDVGRKITPIAGDGVFTWSDGKA